MAKNKIVIFFFFFFSIANSIAQQHTYLVKLKDKSSNTYSVSSPGQFLTAKAIQRRQKCKVSVDEKDLPVTQTYIDQIAATGAQVLYPIKWLNGLVVRSDSTVKAQIASLPFVMSADKNIKSRKASTSATQETSSLCETASETDYAYTQKDMLGMIQMATDGYNGSGMLIAITDNGFLHADTMSVFSSLFSNGQVLDTWDLVDLDKTVYGEGSGHGSDVFSILAGHLPNQMSGPATGAHFLLLRTEDDASESPLEELNWVRAAEMADSIGTDILQVSLGYSTFDDPSLNYTQSDLDGNTSYISQGATIGATRGLVIVVSAGNAGNSSWGKILCPADAIGILSVGAVDASKQRATFSSIGYSADGRVKPDVMAMGSSTSYVSAGTGAVAYGSGTSFASPLISGLAAGLMQAYPTLTHDDLILSVISSADRYASPNADYGYGIPNYQEASAYARLLVASIYDQLLTDQGSELVFPNPMTTVLSLKIPLKEVGHVLNWKLYTVTGALVEEGELLAESVVVNLFSDAAALNKGIYCLTVSYEDHFSTFKVIK